MPPVRSAGRLFSPLDDELELLPGDYSPLLHQRLVQVGNQVPCFARGARLFYMFTGTRASEATVRRYTERAGAVMQQWEEAGGAGEPAAGVPARLVANADGAMVPLLHGKWSEVRTLCIGEVEVGAEGEGRSTKLSYFSRLATAEAFIELAEVEVRRRGLDRAAEVCGGSDGAPWCQRVFDRHCPEAERVLDFMHAAGHVHDFSKVLWAGTQSGTDWWAGEMLHDLKHQGPYRLLRSLAGWAAIGAGKKVGRAADAALHYFESRVELMDYPALRAAGWPIGTGAVESANKLVVEERMKGPGMCDYVVR